MSSNSWYSDYLSALEVRDVHEQALKHAYDAYSKLADRSALQTLTSPPTEQLGSSPSTLIPASTGAKGRGSPRPATPDNLAALRSDLATAQTSKTQLTAQLSTLISEHATLQTTHMTTLARISQLEASQSALQRRLRDREDELKAKKQLLERVQDELLAAEMETNVALEDRNRVEEENRALVGRLIGEKEAEVEKMNRIGGWH